MPFYLVQKISDDVIRIKIKRYYLNVFTLVIYIARLISYFHHGKYEKRNSPYPDKTRVKRETEAVGLKTTAAFLLPIKGAVRHAVEI